MAAAIVPVEVAPRDFGRQALVEDGFLVGDVAAVLDVVDAAIADIGRRQLLGIADDDDLPARAIAPTASQGEICEASSKMTTSNGSLSGGRYCAIESGLIITQGVSLVSAVGILPNSLRSGTCCAFFVSSCESVPHSGSAPKVVGPGMPPPSRERTTCMESSVTRASAARKRAIVSSWRSGRKLRSTGSWLTTRSIHQRA